MRMSLGTTCNKADDSKKLHSCFRVGLYTKTPFYFKHRSSRQTWDDPFAVNKENDSASDRHQSIGSLTLIWYHHRQHHPHHTKIQPPKRQSRNKIMRDSKRNHFLGPGDTLLYNHLKGAVSLVPIHWHELQTYTHDLFVRRIFKGAQYGTWNRRYAIHCHKS